MKHTSIGHVDHVTCAPLHRAQQCQPSATRATGCEPRCQVADAVADKGLGHAVQLGDHDLAHLTVRYRAILVVENFQYLHVIIDMPHAAVVSALPGEWAKLS